MRIHLRTPGGGAHLVLIAERQEHHQFKFKTDRWQTGYMESADDVQSIDYLAELYGGLHRYATQETQLRPVYRSRFEFRIVLGNVCFEITRFTRFAPVEGYCPIDEHGWGGLLEA